MKNIIVKSGDHEYVQNCEKEIYIHIHIYIYINIDIDIFVCFPLSGTNRQHKAEEDRGRFSEIGFW